MSFKIVLDNLRDEHKRAIIPIMNAWEKLIYAHKAGFITYRVVNGSYRIDGKNFDRKAEEWEHKRQEINKYCSQDITLDLLPKSPVTIGKELIKEIADRSREEKRDIFIALGYGKITGQNENEKMIKSIIAPIIKSQK